MELNQLQCFLQVAKTQHMTQAAEQLYITQPALSKSIARLEADLGCKLFDREGKNIRLNEYGQVALRYTEQILYALDDLREELAEMSAAQAGRLRIGSSFPSREPNFLLSAIREFALERPGVRFSLIQCASRNLVSALENREIDIAVSSIPILRSNILWQEMFTERMGVILSEDHPLAARSAISLGELQQEHFFCNNANSDIYDLTYRFCGQAGFQPMIYFEGEFPSYIGEAISKGYGVSIISERGHRRSQAQLPHEAWEEKIQFRPLVEAYCQRTCGIARLESRSSFSLVETFCNYMRTHCQLELDPGSPGPDPGNESSTS